MGVFRAPRPRVPLFALAASKPMSAAVVSRQVERDLSVAAILTDLDQVNLRAYCSVCAVGVEWVWSGCGVGVEWVWSWCGACVQWVCSKGAV